MVWGFCFNGDAYLAIFRNAKTACKIKKQIVSLSSIFFIFLTVVSLAIFFFFGRLRASERQLNRSNRIDWTDRRYEVIKYILLILFLAIGIALLVRNFI